MQDQEFKKSEKANTTSEEGETISSHSTASVNQNDDGSTNHPRRTHSASTHDTTEAKSPGQFIYTITPEKTKKWTRQEKISATAVVLTVMALMATCFSIRQTMRSVNIAEETFKRNREKDSLVAIQKILDDSLDSVERLFLHEKEIKNAYKDSVKTVKQFEKDSLNLVMTNQSIRAQSKTMVAQSKSAEVLQNTYQLQLRNAELSKKALELEYQSDITIKSAAITKFVEGEPIEGVCEFTSVGKVPVIAESMTSATYLTVKKKLDSLSQNPTKNIFRMLPPMQGYYEQYNNALPTYKDVFTRDIYIGQDVSDGIKNGNFVILYFGMIVYTNKVTGKKRLFTFIITLPPPKSPTEPYSGKTFKNILMLYIDYNP